MGHAPLKAWMRELEIRNRPVFIDGECVTGLGLVLASVRGSYVTVLALNELEFADGFGVAERIHGVLMAAIREAIENCHRGSKMYRHRVYFPGRGVPRDQICFSATSQVVVELLDGEDFSGMKQAAAEIIAWDRLLNAGGLNITLPQCEEIARQWRNSHDALRRSVPLIDIFHAARQTRAVRSYGAQTPQPTVRPSEAQETSTTP